MRVHLVQLDIAWEDRAANHDRVLRLVDDANVEPGDLILLPEMFDTGFSMNTPRTADKGGVSLGFLLDLADDTGAFVQGGRTIHDCHCKLASNVMSIISPGAPGAVGDADARTMDEYRKIHPFSLGKEHECFEGGRKVLTYEWTGPNQGRESTLVVCPAICYDLRFPELFRLGLKMGAEAFALGACWPKSRQHHWRALIIARAIENQAFVFGVNRVGKDPANGAFGNALEYAGGSIVVSPTGDVLGELSDAQAVLSVAIDPDDVRRWRDKFPAWKDRKLDLIWS